MYSPDLTFALRMTSDSMTHAEQVRANFQASSWRYYIATALLFLAAIPVIVFSVPGFEVTLSLLLAPAALILFQPTERIHWAVVAVMAFCGALALVGMTGKDGLMRNLLGAASYSSGLPFVLVGMAIAQRSTSITQMWRVVAPVALAMTAIFVIDLVLTGGKLVPSAAFNSTAYQSIDTTYIDSFFPFYGKFAVITLATITMAVGGLAVASAETFRKELKVTILVASSVLLFIAFSMWSRQVMIGVVVFYVVLSLLSCRKRETWIVLSIFVLLLAIWSITPQNRKMGNTKFERSVKNIETGNIDALSTGRVPLYRDAISRLSPEILLKGCGFCNLIDVLDFPFSSMHNVVLTAIYKGGALYALIYLGTAFLGIVLLWLEKKSFGRDASIAVLVSIGAQAMVNDVIYFQVLPALLFATTGYLLEAHRNRISWGR